MNSVPNDVHCLIADHCLDAATIRALCSVDRHWRRICTDEERWRSLWRRDVSGIVGPTRYDAEEKALSSSPITYREAYLRAIRFAESFCGRRDATAPTSIAVMRGWEKILEKHYSMLDSAGKAEILGITCRDCPEHIRLSMRKLRLARLVREANLFERATAVARPVVGSVKCPPY